MKDAPFALWGCVVIIWCVGVLLLYAVGVMAEHKPASRTLEQRIRSLENQMGAMHGEVYRLGVELERLQRKVTQ